MLKPLSDKIVVKPITQEETASGIIIPETVDKEKPEKGEVMAVGPGKMQDNGQRSPMEVKVGDKVLFTKYSPHEVTLDGQDLLVLSESDILAVIE